MPPSQSLPPVNYDVFFRDISGLLKHKLPPGLSHIEPVTLPENNRMGYRLPELRSGQYELLFSYQNRNMSSYFGDAPTNAVAFFYSGPLLLRTAWLNALKPFQELIAKQLGLPMVSGDWGENWAWMAANLNSVPRGIDTFASGLSEFIQATYIPISVAFNSVK